MKLWILRRLNRRKTVGLFIVLFVLTGAIVGYTLQPQRFPNADPSGYGGSPAISGVQKSAMSFSNIDTSGSLPPVPSTSFGGRMVELQGSITIQVNDARAAASQATRLAESLGGYVGSSSFDNSRSSGRIVIRIPETNFSLAMQNLSTLGTVKSQSTSSSDVTEQYINLQAQLDSYRAEQTTLLRILNSSKTVKEALDAENTIQNVQSKINRLEGQLRVMQRLVAFATINAQFSETTNPSLDLGDAMLTALQALYTVTKGVLIVGASLIPVAMIAGIVYLPYKHLRNRRLRLND